MLLTVWDFEPSRRRNGNIIRWKTIIIPFWGPKCPKWAIFSCISKISPPCGPKMGQKLGQSYFVPIESICFWRFGILGPHRGERILPGACFALLCLLACSDNLVRRSLIIIIIITRRDGKVPVKVLLPSSFFLLPSSFFLLPPSFLLPSSFLPPSVFYSFFCTSGLGGRRRKKWSKLKPGRVFEIATKN